MSARAAGLTPWFHHGISEQSVHASPVLGEQSLTAQFHLAETGGLVTQSAPTEADEIAYISGVNASGKLVATSFQTWTLDSYPATYGGASNAHKWGNASAGTSGGTVKYYFDPGSGWSNAEKTAFTDCLKLWSDLTNIKFAQTTNSGAAEITIERGSSGAITYYNYSGGAGAGTIGGHTLYQMTSATVSIDTSEESFGPITKNLTVDGGYPWLTILHELGHAIGLGHGGPYNEGDGIDQNSAQYSPYDSRLWAIMSYVDPTDSSATYYSKYPVKGTNWGTEMQGMEIWNNVPTTPMMLDIAAAQSLYGAPSSTAFDGGQTFGFNCNISDATKIFYDFTKNVNPVVTIWDSGTHNTLDLSGFSANSKISLTAGTFSSCNGQVNNICIAQNTKIDTAIGGSGNDTINGNADANTLNGGNGNDTLYGAGGADKLVGGSGDDTFVYKQAADSTGVHFDTVTGFDATADKFDLWSKVNSVHAPIKSGSLSKASFDSNMTHDLKGSKLASHSAVLFTPSGGDEHGKTFLVVNPTGSAGYHAGDDLVILLSNGAHLSQLSVHDFI